MIELFNFRKTDVYLWAVRPSALVQQIRQAVQGLRAKHHIHIRRTLDDLRAFLAGHTAAHANQHTLGFQVFDAAQITEHFFLRPLAHRAGVEQNQIGFVHVLRRLIALGGVHDIGHLVRVVLVHLATKGFDKDFFAHAASNKVMRSKQSKARPVGAKVQRFMVYVQRL